MIVFVYKMPTTYRCQKRPKSFMENLVGNSRSSHTIVGYRRRALYDMNLELQKLQKLYF